MFFGMFFILDIINWANDSTDAVPFSSMLVVIILWFGISVPLVFLGSYFGYKRDAVEFPTAVSSIPRQVPEQSWFMNAGFVMIVGGILPFGALFVELFLILSSIWMEQVRDFGGAHGRRGPHDASRQFLTSPRTNSSRSPRSTTTCSGSFSSCG